MTRWMVTVSGQSVFTVETKDSLLLNMSLEQVLSEKLLVADLACQRTAFMIKHMPPERLLAKSFPHERDRSYLRCSARLYT
jgi:hypothetical protein